jgi:hypothetical protein
MEDKKPATLTAELPEQGGEAPKHNVTTTMASAFGKMRDKIASDLFNGRGLTGRKLRRATRSIAQKQLNRIVKEVKQNGSKAARAAKAASANIEALAKPEGAE